MHYISEAKRRNAKVIVVDVRETMSSEWADYFLKIIPGTDIVLANAIMHVIIRDELYDEEFVENMTKGFNEIRMVVRKYTPEYAERMTGIRSEVIEEVAKTFALAGSGAVMWGMGVTQHVNGVDNVLALIDLVLLLGYMGEKGGLYPMRGQNNVQGAAYMGALSEYLPGYVELTDMEFRRRLTRIWNTDKIPTERGLYLTEFFDAIVKGDVLALYVMGENPAVSEPNSRKVVEALKKLELLVVQDIFPTKTSRYAHYILPAAAFCEKEGSYMNSERRIQWSSKVCDPPGDAKPDWEILTLLGKALGLPSLDYKAVEEITAEYFKLFPELEDREIGELKTPEGVIIPKKRLYTWSFATPDGKAHFRAVEYVLPWETPDDEYPFIFVTMRTMNSYNTGEMSLRSPSLAKLMKEPIAKISKEDAKRLGIHDGELIIIETRRGRIRIKAKIGDIKGGVVAVPFHSKVNRITSDALNKAGTPELKFSACKVYKA